METLRKVLAGTVRDTSLWDATVRLPDGREKDITIVERPAVVGILPVEVVDGDPEVLLVRQPRPVVGKEQLVEVIGGRIENEEPIATARRELGEEVGLKAAVWHLLAGPLFASPGFCDEATYQFLAAGLTPVPAREEDSHIRPWRVGLDELVELALAGELPDAGASRAVLHLGLLHSRGRLTELLTT